MSLSFTETACIYKAENINFVEYFVIDKHFFEQIFRKVEPESFLYEFLNSGDPLYLKLQSLQGKSRATDRNEKYVRPKRKSGCNKSKP